MVLSTRLSGPARRAKKQERKRRRYLYHLRKNTNVVVEMKRRCHYSQVKYNIIVTTIESIELNDAYVCIYERYYYIKHKINLISNNVYWCYNISYQIKLTSFLFKKSCYSMTKIIYLLVKTCNIIGLNRLANKTNQSHNFKYNHIFDCCLFPIYH